MSRPPSERWDALVKVLGGRARVDVGRLVGDLLSLRYPLPSLEPKSVAGVISRLCKLVNVSNRRLAHDMCKLTSILCSRQRPAFDDKDGLNGVFDFIFAFLKGLGSNGDGSKHKNNLAVCLDALICILEGNVHKVPGYHDKLVNLLIPLSDISVAIEVRKKAIIAVGKLCVRLGPSHSYERIFNNLMACFNECSDNVHSDESYVRLLRVVLHSIQVLIHTIDDKDLKAIKAVVLESLLKAEFMTHIFRLCFFDTPYYRVVQPAKTSDDDVDLDYDIVLEHMRMRVSALQVVQELAKSTGAATFYKYWKEFLPDTKSHSSSKNPSEWQWMDDDRAPVTLLTLIIHDSDANVRAAAAITLSEMFNGSLKLLSTADDSARAGSYTSLSTTLAGYIRECHDGLLCAISYETNHTVLPALLKCLSNLVLNSSYSRLQNGMCSRVPTQLLSCGLIDLNRDVSVRVAALKTIAASLGTVDVLPEMESMFADTILDTLLDLLADHFKDVRKEALITMQRGAGQYPAQFWELWSEITPKLLNLLDKDESVFVLGVLEEATKKREEGFDDFPWPDIIELYLQPSLASEIHNVRITALDILASISTKSIDTQLSGKQRFFIVTSVLSRVEDMEETIEKERGAACRVLGQVVFAHEIRHDEQILGDILNAIDFCFINGKIKTIAGWVLANLCQALLDNSREGIVNNSAFLSQVTKLTLRAISGVNYKEKDANGARALGCCLAVASHEMLVGNDLWSNALQALINCMPHKQPKTRWNASYGLGLALGNINLRETGSVIRMLCRAVESDENFKVRIKAADALRACQSREQYGEEYMTVWKALVGCDTEEVADPHMFRYRDALLKEIALSMHHLLSMKAKGDEYEFFETHAAQIEKLIEGVNE